MIWPVAAIPLIAAAIEGKYGDGSSRMVECRLVQMAPLLDVSASEAALRAHLAPPHSPEQDIDNQLIVIVLIEKWWSRGNHSGVGIRDVHRALFGGDPVDAVRTLDHVPDFGGSTIISWQEVGCRIDELEIACREMADEMASAAPPIKARFLAYVFASIIRIHPFPDGNGRTARMYVQYLLRRWGDPYVVIPKIRNDPDWREALERAMPGDIRALQSQFERRMMEQHDAV
jgi:fido (protein-threonine AMPylation protein)